jgi:hypothetical protein
MDDHDHLIFEPQRTKSESRLSLIRRQHGLQLAALLLVIASFSATGFLMNHLLEEPPQRPTASTSSDAPKPSDRLFRLWPRDRQPDLVLVLSGETFSYLQPCGCSRPQHGGLERRFNFLRSLVKGKNWPIVSLDLGDVAQSSGPQTLLKYVYSMRALNHLGYTAVGIGRNEMAIPLIDALSEYALNNPTPRVLSANLLNKDLNFPDTLKSWVIATPKNAPKVGVIGVVAKSVAQQVNDPMVKFDDVDNAVMGVLKEIQPHQPDLLVLLFQGTVQEAKATAAKHPQLNLILCQTVEDDPPQKPDQVGKTMIVSVGHKGRYLGTVGVYRQANAPPQLHYELVLLSPDYETPAGQEKSNPIFDLLENYTKDVKKGNYLAQYPKTDHPIQREPGFKGATYVGSEKCKECHQTEYDIWKASPHSHAYTSLEKAQRPSLRQYDGECVRCHVTGFSNTGGFTDAKATPLLKDTGCENCHGPGSLHVDGNTSKKLLALMNPYKTKKDETEAEKKQRLLRLGDSCRQCHDLDNDVHWSIEKWVTGKIDHGKTAKKRLTESVNPPK